jgi:cell division protein FtsB
MQQNEEIVHLKKKIVEHKKKEEELEKNIKTLREQTSTL